MEYQPYQNKTFNYGSLHHYGEAKCGTGVIAPVFSVYAFGTEFLKNTKTVPLCSPSMLPEKKQTFYGDFPYAYNESKTEFNKMMRQKK